MNLLVKGAIEVVPPAQSESGFYSRYFLVPKKDGGLRPILDLRLLNHTLTKRSFRMITLKQLISQIRPGDWFMSLDLKDTYFHIQVAPPSQTILEICIWGGGISIQGPPVWAVPGSPHFYTMYGCGSLPSATDGNSHPQLPRWLAHSGPVRGSFNIAQDPPPQPLRSPGAQGQLCQEHAVTQPTSIVPGDSYRLSADDSNCLSGTSHDNSAPRSLLQRRDRPLAQGLPENAGSYGSGFASSLVGPASHAAHPVLAEAEGSICGLALRSPSHNGNSGLCISPDPLEGPPLAEAGCDLRHGAHKEGCHDRCFQQRLGSTVRGQTDLRSLVRRGVGSAHQLPRNASSVPCLSILPTGHKGTPCANTLRQQVRVVIHKSPGRHRLEAPLHAGERPSCLGSDQSALTEGNAWAGQDEPRSGHVVKEQRLLRRMDAPPARGSENLGSLWQSSSRPICLRRQLSLPNLFHEEHGCPGPRVAQPSALCVPSNRSATAGTQTSQGTTAQASFNSPPLEEPTVGVGVIPAARSSPVAHSLETGPPLSSERHAVASTAWVMGPAWVAAQREPFDLLERVLNTMAEARVPSTRRLYALKWSIFSAGVKTVTWIRLPLMYQWFFHFCRRCWINSVPHPPSRFTQQP